MIERWNAQPLLDMTRPKPDTRVAYRHFLTIPTRWHDNDVYGHVNNTVYYSYFDTIVNQFLIEAEALDPLVGSVVGLVVETKCSHFASLTFPEKIDAGMRVAHIGDSSVRYEIALFSENAESAAAQGYFVHVYVDRLTRQPTALPQKLRAALMPLFMAH